jgi:hypothetical protein
VSSSHPMRRIEILLFDGLDELDVVAPFEILVSAGYRVDLVTGPARRPGRRLGVESPQERMERGASRRHSRGDRRAARGGCAHRGCLHRGDVDRCRRHTARQTGGHPPIGTRRPPRIRCGRTPRSACRRRRRCAHQRRCHVGHRFGATPHRRRSRPGSCAESGGPN